MQPHLHIPGLFKERETTSHAFMYLFSFHSDSKIPSFGKLQSIIEIINQKTLPTPDTKFRSHLDFAVFFKVRCGAVDFARILEM